MLFSEGGQYEENEKLFSAFHRQPAAFAVSYTHLAMPNGIAGTVKKKYYRLLTKLPECKRQERQEAK